MVAGLTLPIFLVDAFTDRPFKGNPAAVCLLDTQLEPSLMQSIAAELKVSETAFLCPLEVKNTSKAGSFTLRWFTPEAEVPLCGHATLATAAVLYHELGNVNPDLEFKTASGTLRARPTESGYELDFPERPSGACELDPHVLEALGVSEAEDTRRTADGRGFIVRVAQDVNLPALKPNFDRLMAVAPEGIKGLILTQKGQPPHDFVSRYFAPWVGIPEDPVTGTAHCALAPYWGELLQKDQFLAYQASARGGELRVSRANGRVYLEGGCVVMLKGFLYV